MSAFTRTINSHAQQTHTHTHIHAHTIPAPEPEPEPEPVPVPMPVTAAAVAPPVQSAAPLSVMDHSRAIAPPQKDLAQAAAYSQRTKAFALVTISRERVDFHRNSGSTPVAFGRKVKKSTEAKTTTRRELKTEAALQEERRDTKKPEQAAVPLRTGRPVRRDSKQALLGKPPAEDRVTELYRRGKSKVRRARTRTPLNLRTPESSEYTFKPKLKKYKGFKPVVHWAVKRSAQRNAPGPGSGAGPEPGPAPGPEPAATQAAQAAPAGRQPPVPPPSMADVMPPPANLSDDEIKQVLEAGGPWLVLSETINRNGLSVDDTFRAFDRHGQGQITADDLVHGFNNVARLAIPPSDVLQTLQGGDGDGDGHISYADFWGALGLTAPAPPPPLPPGPSGATEGDSCDSRVSPFVRSRVLNHHKHGLTPLPPFQ